MPKPNLTTSIIAGEFKGKKLQLPSLEVTRSSKQILKESFFNTVQFDIIDGTFVELFAGSGSVGLEALSRGAKTVHFFEKDANSYKVLNSNINATHPKQCHAVHGDVFEHAPALFKALKDENQSVFYYADPPFSIRDEMSDIYNKTVALLEEIPPKSVALLAIEHESTQAMPALIGQLKQIKAKRFGKTTLSYFAPNN